MQRLGLLVEQKWLDEIDAWRQTQLTPVGRSYAIRVLVQQALNAAKK